MTNPLNDLRSELLHRSQRFADVPFALDASFSEGDHPRAPDGKFGSGGGGAHSDVPTVAKAGPAGLPFVGAFMKAHTTMAAQKAHLEKQPPEKLHKALELIEKHKAIDPAASHVKKMIQEVLGSKDKMSFPSTGLGGTLRNPGLGGSLAKDR